MNILLIDDHTLFREGLALLLAPLPETPPTIWHAGSCGEAFALIEARGEPDLVLIDLAMPGVPGMQGLAWLRERHPALPAAVLSSSDDRDTVLRSIDAGAMGFVPKSSSTPLLLAALRVILAGGVYLPPIVFGPSPTGTTTPTPVPPSRRPSEFGMTPRQADVLWLILQGLSTKLIQRRLGLSEGTVKAHTSAVLRALNVTTRTQAVIAAGRLGLRFDAPAPAAPGGPPG